MDNSLLSRLGAKAVPVISSVSKFLKSQVKKALEQQAVPYKATKDYQSGKVNRGDYLSTLSRSTISNPLLGGLTAPKAIGGVGKVFRVGTPTSSKIPSTLSSPKTKLIDGEKLVSKGKNLLQRATGGSKPKAQSSKAYKGSSLPGIVPPFDEIPQRKTNSILNKLGRLKDQLIVPSRKILEKSGNAGKEAARKIDNYYNTSERTAGEAVLNLRNSTKGVNEKTVEKIYRFLDGQQVPLSSKERVVATKLRGYLDDFATKSEKVGLEIRLPNGTAIPFHPRGNYLPHIVDEGKLLANRNITIQHLVKTGQMPDVQTSASFVDDIINGNPIADTYKKFNPDRYVPLSGNLEYARLIEWPTEVLRYDKNLLADYFSAASKRLARAENFGVYDQELQKILNQATKEGADPEVIEDILRRNLNLVKDNKILSEGFGAIRQVESASKLGLSAISNLGQSVNTATKFGVRNTAKAITQAFGQEGKDYALKIGATLDDVLREVEESGIDKKRNILGKITAPGFRQIEKLNRTIASLVGRNVGAKQGLSGEALDKFAQEAVNLTQFKTRPIDLPPAWATPTGKLLTQFKNFSFKHAEFITNEVFKTAIQGNVKPLVRYLILGLGVGEVIGDIKALVRGRERPQDPLERALDNLAVVGGAGTYQDALNALSRGSAAVVNWIVGPSVSDAGKLLGGIGEAAQGSTKTLGRLALGAIPVIGPALSQSVYPREGTYKTRVPDLIDEGIGTIFGETKEKRGVDLFNKMQKMSQEKREAALLGIAEEDEGLFDAYVQAKDDSENKVTDREKSIRGEKIVDGTRIKSIVDELNRLPDPGSRSLLLERYVDIGIINNEDTLEKIIELRSGSKNPEDLESGLVKSVYAAEESSVNNTNVVSIIPQKAKQSATKNIPIIEQALEEEGINSPEVLAYALATLEHETAGTFEPISEYSGRQQAAKKGYGGGEDYYGRGFIQLTHDYNYEKYGDLIGEDLVNDPELANNPEIAARVLALYFKETGIPQLVNKGQFVQARSKVNPDGLGRKIANRARQYLSYLNK